MAKTFKDGEVVKVIDFSSIRYNGTYKIEGDKKDSGKYYCRRQDDDGGTKGCLSKFYPSQLARIGEQMKTKGSKENTQEEYSFSIKHPRMILAEEINVSREYPIAIVDVEDFDSVIVFHKSIIIKASALNMIMPKYTGTFSGDGFIKCPTGKDKGYLLTLLKRIIKTEWGTLDIPISIKMLSSQG